MQAQELRANSVIAYANLSFVLTAYGCQTGALRGSQEAIRHNALCAAFGTYSVCFLTTPWLLARGGYGFLTSKKLFAFCFHQVATSSTNRCSLVTKQRSGRESADIWIFRTVDRKFRITAKCLSAPAANSAHGSVCKSLLLSQAPSSLQNTPNATGPSGLKVNWLP